MIFPPFYFITNFPLLYFITIFLPFYFITIFTFDVILFFVPSLMLPWRVEMSICIFTPLLVVRYLALGTHKSKLYFNLRILPPGRRGDKRK